MHLDLVHNIRHKYSHLFLLLFVQIYILFWILFHNNFFQPPFLTIPLMRIFVCQNLIHKLVLFFEKLLYILLE